MVIPIYRANNSLLRFVKTLLFHWKLLYFQSLSMRNYIIIKNYKKKKIKKKLYKKIIYKKIIYKK